MDQLQNLDVQYIGFVEGHHDWVTSLVCGTNKDGSPLLISGSRDKSIIVWSLDLNNPKEIHITKEGKDKKDTYTDNKLGKPLKSLNGHSHFVSSLALSSDNKKLISGSWDTTVRLWDLPSMSTQQLFNGHTKDVLCVGFSHDERMIFSGGMDKTVKYWNSMGKCQFTNTQFGGWVSSMTNIKKGKENYMAIGSWDAKINILGSDYTNLRAIQGNDYAVTSMAAADDGEFLFVGHKNGTIRLWNLGSETSTASVPDALKQTIETNVDINTLCFENLYFKVITIGTATGLQIREVEKGSLITEKKFNKNCPCLSLTFDQQKNYLFAGFADGTIRIFKFAIK